MIQKEGKLMKKVQEVYKLRADGRVKDLPLIVGHPMIGVEKGWIHEVLSRSRLIVDQETNPIQHEGIMAKEPCHPFLDIDRDGTDWVQAEAAAQVTIVRVVERIHQYKGRGDYVIFDSTHPSRPDKYSIHVVFYNDWVSSPCVLNVLTEGIDGIDRMPYHHPGRETPTFLRFPYSQKIGPVDGVQQIQPKIRCIPRGGPREFDLTWFLKGCISIGMLDPPDTFLNIPEPEGRPPSELPPPGMYRAIQLIVSEMTSMLPKVDRVTAPKFNGASREWLVKVYPGQYCREHKHKTGTGYHKSNGSLMGMLVNKYEEHKVYIKCMDAECDGMVTLYPVDFRDLYMDGLGDAITQE
jgi:hypothetical protein